MTPATPFNNSRRDFIKFVVAGSVAAGCPIDHTLVAAAPTPADSAPRVDGEHFEICHEVRDGHTFDLPAASRKVEVVIIGAGSAGLSAAYFLRGKDFLLLEKEDHFGGNAYQEEFDGQPFATGSAYAFRGDEGDQLAKEIGLNLLPVDNPDPTIVNKTFVADTWIKGIDELPYPKEVRASFRKFRDDMRKIDLAARMNELDAEPFTKFTAGYAPEVQSMVRDGFGPSELGVRPAKTRQLTWASTRCAVLPRARTVSASFFPVGSAASRTNSSKCCGHNIKTACSAMRPSSPSCLKKMAFASATRTKTSSPPSLRKPC